MSHIVTGGSRADGSSVVVAGRQAGVRGKAGRAGSGRSTFLLLLPSLILVGLFVVIPVLTNVIFSLLRVEYYRFKPELTLENYADIFTFGAWKFTLETMVKTLGMAALVLGMVILGAYPIAYLLGRKIKSPVIQTFILLLCILPFWTSYIIRMITWVPLLASTGVINSILIGAGIIREPITSLLFSYQSMVIVQFFLWVVFMIGPIFWMISRIPEEVMEASLNLGASPLKRFLTITLPLSVPGIATGTLFVFVMIMSDFATPRIVGGGHYFLFSSYVANSMQNSEFALAGAYSTILTVTTLIFVYLLTRLVDLRKEL